MRIWLENEKALTQTMEGLRRSRHKTDFRSEKDGGVRRRARAEISLAQHHWPSGLSRSKKTIINHTTWVTGEERSPEKGTVGLECQKDLAEKNE